MVKTYTLAQVIERMEFDEVAIKIDGGGGKPYKGAGTIIFFDENDDGALKFFYSRNDVVVCKKTGLHTDDVWIITDKPVD